MTHAPDGRGTVDGSRAPPASRDSTPKLRVRSRFLLCSGLSCLDRPLAKSRRATHERPRRLGLARAGAYWSDASRARARTGPIATMKRRSEQHRKARWASRVILHMHGASNSWEGFVPAVSHRADRVKPSHRPPSLNGIA